MQAGCQTRRLQPGETDETFLMMRIALFGGSFDPPHWGHVLAAAYAQVAGHLDRIWVLPAYQHPYRKPMSAWDQRFRMCQVAFDRLGFVEVRDEERRNPTGFTVDLVERLQAAHLGHTWFLVGGSDTAADMMNWHRGTELARLLTVLAVPRSGYDRGPSALPAISSTDIRALVSRRQSIDEYVPPEVARLIAEFGWYRSPHDVIHQPK